MIAITEDGTHECSIEGDTITLEDKVNDKLTQMAQGLLAMRSPSGRTQEIGVERDHSGFRITVDGSTVCGVEYDEAEDRVVVRAFFNVNHDNYRVAVLDDYSGRKLYCSDDEPREANGGGQAR